MSKYQCEHEMLEVTTEPFLKGFDDYVGGQCMNCFEYLELPIQKGS
jgi:hypothetical protein